MPHLERDIIHEFNKVENRLNEALLIGRIRRNGTDYIFASTTVAEYVFIIQWRSVCSE